jgi:hypothetical protein
MSLWCMRLSPLAGLAFAFWTLPCKNRCPVLPAESLPSLHRIEIDRCNPSPMSVHVMSLFSNIGSDMV